MKTPNGQDPARWKDLPPTGAGPETEIGAAIRLMRSEPRATERRLPFPGRRAGVAAQARRRTVRGWSLMPAWAGRTALIGGSLLVGGMAAALSGKFIQHFNETRRQPVPATSTGPAQSRTAHRKARAIAAPADALAPPTVALAPALPEPPAPSFSAPSRSKRPVRRALAMLENRERPANVTAVPAPLLGPTTSLPAAPATEPTTPLSFSPVSNKPAAGSAWVAPAVKLHPELLPARPRLGEAALIARALARLRRDHDPLWALDDLNEHDRRYPHGNLDREAALTRAEALLDLKRGHDALVVLDKLKMEPTATDRRARLARAELRAQDGRPTEAISDFDRVLDLGGDDALAARAVYGRAVCRVRGGDLGGTRTDLRDYLRRFPQGAQRADVEKMLRRLGS